MPRKNKRGKLKFQFGNALVFFFCVCGMLPFLELLGVTDYFFQWIVSTLICLVLCEPVITLEEK